MITKILLDSFHASVIPTKHKLSGKNLSFQIIEIDKGTWCKILISISCQNTLHIFRIDVHSPWRHLKIEGLEKYKYFHLAKWLRVPIVKEFRYSERITKPWQGQDHKLFCAGNCIDVHISRNEFDLRDNGYLMIRKIMKRKRSKSIGSPLTIHERTMLENPWFPIDSKNQDLINRKRFGIPRALQRITLQEKSVTSRRRSTFYSEI